MLPDPTISSILTRYERDEPVTAEEKAVLHKWLRHALRRKNIPQAELSRQQGQIGIIRKKIQFWEYVIIVLIVLIIIFMLYMLTIKMESSRPEYDNVQIHNKEIRKAGRKDRLELFGNSC